LDFPTPQSVKREIEFEPQLKHVLSVFAVTFDQKVAGQFVHP
jgi:hypothetical protein